MPTTVRAAKAQDIPSMAEIWHAGWHLAHAAHVPHALTKRRVLDDFVARLESLWPQSMVVERDARVAGFCVLRGAELYQFYISAETMGTGVADVLMAEACAKIAQSNAKRAFLYAIPENARAVRFYQKHGWHITQTAPVDVETSDGPFSLTCHRLEKELT